MALNIANLASEIEQEIRTNLTLGPTPYPQLTNFCNALSTAIINHIKDNAELTNVVLNLGTDTQLTAPNNHDHEVTGTIQAGIT